jgi:hypothetical protein
VAWCDECDRLVEDDELVDGECPQCGTALGPTPPRHIPWYFRAMVVAFVIYLGYRTYQGVTWVVHHI